MGATHSTVTGGAGSEDGEVDEDEGWDRTNSIICGSES